MPFIKLIHDGIPTVINPELILVAGYEEAKQRLQIRFAGGETVIVQGQEAERVWALFSREAELYEGDDQAEIDEADEDEVTDDFEDINQEMADLETQLADGNITRLWAGQRLRDSARNLGSYWPTKKKRALSEELKKVKERALAIADQAEMAALSNMINECLRAAFTSSVSVASTVKKLTEVQVELQRRKKLTPELKQQIREGKERAARHRARKKLNDAQIAQAGGSLIKYEKYKREAEAILKQDWATIFPKEQLPSFESLQNAETN
jgi:predicted  nucleic acid-binding Zn-ribbon protein